jgi:hypothetical protein
MGKFSSDPACPKITSYSNVARLEIRSFLRPGEKDTNPVKNPVLKKAALGVGLSGLR